MNPFSRRRFLQSTAAAAIGGAAVSRLAAIEPLSRIHPRIAGLSMSSYSLKPHMKWWWGDATEGDMDMLGYLDYCAEQGLDGAELTSYFFELPLTARRINAIKRRAHLNGLNITGGAIGNDFSHAPDSEHAREQMRYVETWINHFADLGAPAIRVFASRSLPQGITDEQVIDNVSANLETALKIAEKRGVMLGLENHDFTMNIDRLLVILRRIESDWLGVTWDSANLVSVPDPYAALARIAPYAIVAQVKVTTKVNGRPVRADFERLIRVLREAGYSGYIVFEYEEAEDPYETVPGHLKELRRAIAATE